MTRFLLLLPLMLMAGGVSALKPEMRTADPVKTIDIRSWPSGLVVELNVEYVGTTPVELVVNSTRSGNWTADFARGFSPIIMRASTPDTSGCEHKIWYPGDRIPSRVLFRIPGAMKRLAVN